jgi:uncharacterized membrane protein YphA (DoxX/SURF4 family)
MRAKEVLMNMLRYLLALVLIMHGIGHVMGFTAAWAPNIEVGFTGVPSILWSEATVESTVGKVFGLRWLVALVASVGAGLSLLFGYEWWRALAIASAFISLAAIVPWLNTVPSGARFGALLVDLLILLVLLFPWSEQLIRTLHLP